VQKEREILALNAFDQSRASAMGAELREAVQRRLRSFGKASVLFYEEPIRMERAEGVYMFDVEGRRYLDLYNNVPSVGHSHPRVVEAVRRQVGVLNIHTRYLNDVVDVYAERLLAAPNLQRLPEEVRGAIARHGMRNGLVTSIAPTGKDRHHL